MREKMLERELEKLVGANWQVRRVEAIHLRPLVSPVAALCETSMKPDFLGLPSLVRLFR